MKFIILTLFILVSSAAKAELWNDHISPTLKDGFDQKGLMIIAAGLVGIGISQPYDYENRARWGSHQKINSSISRVGDLLGSGIPGSLIALSQIYWDEENGYAHAEALVDSFVVTSILKQAGQRNRPNSSNKHSMPSGHTSTSFTTATSLTYAYGLKAAIPAYAAATFVAATRWSDDAHWLSDTVAGVAIGIFWGRATYNHHSEKTETVYNIVPVISHDFIGGIASLNF